MNDRNDSAEAIKVVLLAVAFQEPTEDVDDALDTLTTAELNELHRTANELRSFVSYAIERRTPHRVSQRRKEVVALMTEKDHPYAGDLPLTGNPYPQV